MKTLIFVFILCSFATSAFANPTTITCNGENILDPINKIGVVKFQFNPFVVTWISDNNQIKTLFNQEVICGRNITNTEIKPTCEFQDKSDAYLRYVLACDTKYENGDVVWFAKGGITISNVTSNGRFECRTKYGNNYTVVVNLTSCH